MKVRLVSFGFKYGPMEDANYLWDVRFLPNPYWVAELRPLTGHDHDVSEYVVGSAEGHDFLKIIKPVLLYLLQQNRGAGKEELVVAVGCTGGRHRSVAVVEVLSDLLQVMPCELSCEHRDVEREV